MNKYQIALNRIIRSCCPHCHDDNGCQNCEIKQVCNAIAKDWVDTLQELIDKETPMKVIAHHYEEISEKPYIKYSCPNCDGKYALHPHFHKYCLNCGQKLDWSDINE